MLVAGEVYIRHGPEHKQVRAGETVTFRCMAGTESLLRGAPVIHWHKDDENIDFSHGVWSRFRKDPLDNSLQILDTETADTGLYACVAKLDGESASASAQLIVEGK